MKILRNHCLHFSRQDGRDGKKWKENHATKVTKIPKTKRRKYGMNETIISTNCQKYILTFIQISYHIMQGADKTFIFLNSQGCFDDS